MNKNERIAALEGEVAELKQLVLGLVNRPQTYGPIPGRSVPLPTPTPEVLEGIKEALERSDKERQQSSKKKTIESKSPVIFRYVRPTVLNPQHERVISNLHGIAIAFRIDYAHNTLTAGWSVCHDTNFDSKEGRRMALARLEDSREVITVSRDQRLPLIENLILEMTSEDLGSDNENYETLREAFRKHSGRIAEFQRRWFLEPAEE